MANNTKFDQWQVEETLQEPTVFTVRIRNRPNEGLYVLKTIGKSSKKNNYGYFHFRREIETLIPLDHRNVLTVVDYSFNPNQPYFVTRYHNYGTLEEYNGSKRWKRAICKQIFRGYSYLHQQGIAKADNNAKNILRQNSSGSLPQAIVGDFGGCTRNADPDRIACTWMKVFRMLNKFME